MRAGLAIAVVSITSTARRRFFWAVWWSSAPTRKPLTKPDASSGGARSKEEALASAEHAAGRPLAEIDPVWARAWKRTLRGEPPFTPIEEAILDGRPPRPRAPTPANAPSIWSVLEIAEGATLAEIKRAYRARSLVTHPDRGGDADAFRAVQRAYEEAIERRARPKARRATAPAKPR